MATKEFRAAQDRVLDRFGVDAASRFVDVAVSAGRAHVLVSGQGPAVVMLNGVGTPAAMWAPLMAKLKGFTLYAVDLPGFGLTDTTSKLAFGHRSFAVRFLDEVLDGLGLAEAAFVGNSLGSLWTLWLALDRPDRVVSMSHVGCPAIVAGTTAPLPMRLMSVPALARVLSKLDPPSPKQVTRLSKMVHQHPLVPEIADVLLATERLPACEEVFQPTLHTLLRLRGPRPDMVLDGDDLARITQPTQLIWGKDDPFGSQAQGKRIAAAFPNGAFHLVDGGHAPWLNNPDHIGQLVNQALTPTDQNHRLASGGRVRTGVATVSA